MARKAARQDAARLGRRGTLVIPAALRRRYGLEEGSFVLVEERADGILVRPAIAVPVERYDARKRAEFLLNNAVDAEDYAAAVEEVRRTGVDPASVPHRKPGKK
jgi:AbrB family looped-hinge helix DNA binding protein